jgi:prepilin-type N-terminal cleavage/methylation domain-containing protein
VSDFRDAPRPRRDAGFTLIEILIAIVLLGGVIAGTMATLRATTLSGALHRDHSKAHEWLQSASDMLYAYPKLACNTTDADEGESAVRTAYDTVVKGVPNPPDWKDWQIRVVPTVKFWNSANLDADPDKEYFFGSDCDPNLTLQLIELEVKSPSGRIIESVEIVK